MLLGDCAWMTPPLKIFVTHVFQACLARPLCFQEPHFQRLHRLSSPPSCQLQLSLSCATRRSNKRCFPDVVSQSSRGGQDPRGQMPPICLKTPIFQQVALSLYQELSLLQTEVKNLKALFWKHRLEPFRSLSVPLDAKGSIHASEATLCYVITWPLPLPASSLQHCVDITGSKRISLRWGGSTCHLCSQQCW